MDSNYFNLSDITSKLIFFYHFSIGIVTRDISLVQMFESLEVIKCESLLINFPLEHQVKSVGRSKSIT